MKNKYFLFPYITTLLVLLVLLFNFNKMELHLFLSQNRSVFTDYFFKYWTDFGGNLPFIFIGILFFYKYSTAFYLLTAQLVGTIFSVTLKQIFSSPRPKLYFQQYFPEIDLPQIQGMHIHSTHSMPSGHTISAFAFFFGIALITKNKYVKLLCFLAAALVGFSRIYLSQHFAEDVFVGSIIGVLCAWFCFRYYQKWDKKFDNRSLRDLFKRKNTELFDNQK